MQPFCARVEDFDCWRAWGLDGVGSLAGAAAAGEVVEGVAGAGCGVEAGAGEGHLRLRLDHRRL